MYSAYILAQAIQEQTQGQSVAIFLSAVFLTLAVLMILLNLRTMVVLAKTKGRIKDVTIAEDMVYETGGVIHYQQVPEVEFTTAEGERVSIKIYESLLKKYKAGDWLTVYYKKQKNGKDYTVHFPFSRLKFLFIALLATIGYILWLVSTTSTEPPFAY